MSIRGYKIDDQEAVHFITCTVHQWVDVFTRRIYVDVLLDSIRYCQKNKGLEVYAWVVMSNHIHLIVRSQTGQLSNTIRDFKKYTSRQLIEAIKNNPMESRKDWLLWLFRKEEGSWFWEEGFHPEEIRTTDFFRSKVDYIHFNPVRAGIVEKEEEYLLSSCGDFYATRKGLLDLTIW
jgi:putative transposase